MGLFSRDETVSVASVIYPLGEEIDKVPDMLKVAVISSGLQQTSRPAAIDKAIFDGTGVKLSQGYKYAARHYYAGLPIGLALIKDGVDDVLIETLCEEWLATVYVGHTVDVKSVDLRWGNNAEVVEHNIFEADYNYDFFEDAVHTAVGAVDVGAELVYEVLPLDDILHPGEIGYRLTFTNPDTSIETFDEWYSDTIFNGHETIENRLVMEVSIDGAPCITIKYAYGDGDPRLNLLLTNTETPRSGTFPAIVVKKNNKYLNTDAFDGVPWKTSPAYKTSKTYAKRMGVNLDDIIALVEGNADQKKIDYAFIQPGTFVNSPNRAAAEYHYKYFHQLFLSYSDNKPAYDAWVTASSYPTVSYVSKSQAKNCPAQSVRIYDPDNTKNTVNMEIAWRYMTYEEKAGSIPAAYVVECGAQEIVSARFRKGAAKFKTVNYDVTKVYFRKRLTDSTYAELMVVGLWHENYVYKGYSVQSGVWDMFNDPEGDFGTGFLIPLEYSIFMSLSGRERLQLAQEAMHIVFNCYKVVKEPWYATGIFKIILAVVAIVVVVLSWGSLGPQVAALYSSVSAAVGTALVGASLTVIAAVAAVITAAILVGIQVGISFVAKEAGEWAAEQWGPEWGAVVQIVATVALSWGVGKALGSFTGFTMPAMTVSQQVFMASSYILTGLATYTDFAMQELEEARAKWNDYVTDPDNPLTEVNKLMDELFEPDQYITEALFAPRETLDEFLARTLTSVDSLIFRMTLPISHQDELTLTTRLP
jgi:hypothetical protein